MRQHADTRPQSSNIRYTPLVGPMHLFRPSPYAFPSLSSIRTLARPTLIK